MSDLITTVSAPHWLGVIIPFISGLLGVAFGSGIFYGAFRIRAAGWDRRIAALEQESKLLVPKDVFTEYRKDCREEIKDDIQDIRSSMSSLNDKFDRYLMQSLARGERHGKQDI